MEGLHMEEEEPQYDKQDLEQDLYLAAELGKTLLERNREMEDSLQELYLTSEEQVQEIEYLSKQLEMLREMNEQHAKVYEQLDVSAHKLELTNQKLVEESKESQQKIERLTGTMEALQNQVDSLTARVEELRSLEQLRARTELRTRHRTVYSFPCFQELSGAGRYEEGTLRNLEMEQNSLEEENDRLREVLAALQASMSSERSQREGAERECAHMLQQSAHLEERLLVAEGCQQHVLELEAELRELQQLGGVRGVDRPSGVPDTPAAVGEGRAREEGTEPKGKGGGTGLVPPESTSVHKSCSDTALNSIDGRDAPGRKPVGYGPRANGIPGQGMSILREVDEQYHALLERYEELLGKCRRREDSLHHAGVQTSRPVSRDSSTRDCTSLDPPPNAVPAPVSPEAPDGVDGQPETEDSRAGHHTPEYKALFKEIFSHIQKTKGEGKASKGRKGNK
ncbi:cerebellar degeneration-related protein 2-like isoform X2 [Arapaima gigas]